MHQFIEKSFFNAMSVRKSLQHLKALERAPQGTLAFRSYLLKRCRVISHNKAFGVLELNTQGLMNELLTGKKRVKVNV